MGKIFRSVARVFESFNFRESITPPRTLSRRLPAGPAFYALICATHAQGQARTDSPAIDGGRIDSASMRMPAGQPRHLMLAGSSPGAHGQTSRHDAGAPTLLPAAADDGLLRGREPRPHFRGRLGASLSSFTAFASRRAAAGKPFPAPTATIAPPPGTRAAVRY